MKNSQFEAKTFGVGELISQRKLFRVPPHQRSYAWDKDSVEEFLVDIEAALSNGASDYFVGLIVIQATPHGEWLLLDGQQRLTTVSLIYAAIRQWLLDKGYDDDAKQIDHEYLGVRRLGGEYSSRMLLNEENQVVFQSAVAEQVSDRQLRDGVPNASRSASNKQLVNAALACRAWIRALGDFSSPEGEVVAAEKIYGLARFLDSRLKVVAVEVSSDVDAYILFESLNDRGVALSALDLVKNYIFSRAPNKSAAWTMLLDDLGSQNPEDFLKIFWTSRRGLIAKSQIFKGIKSVYDSQQGVTILLEQMRQDASIFSALGDEDHPVWESYSSRMRDLVFLIRSLDSKQARPLLIAILRDLSDEEVAFRAIWMVTVAIVRFQVVGKGRTGVVEKVFGRLCERIADGRLKTSAEFKQEIAELLVEDGEFYDAFRRHEDKKYSRIAIFLAADAAAFFDGPKSGALEVRAVRHFLDHYRPLPIYSLSSLASDADLSLAENIGHFRLVKADQADDDLAAVPLEPNFSDYGFPDIVVKRSEILASHAVRIWSVESAQ